MRRPPFAEAVGHHVLDEGDDPLIVVVVPDEPALDAVIDDAKVADVVPYDRFGGLWHVGADEDGREGMSFHLIERGMGHDGFERVWGIYAPPASLLRAAGALPHLVAVLPARKGGPAEQPTLELRHRIGEALIVEVEEHSATMQPVRGRDLSG